jgi:hypothetical protein
MKAFPIDNAEQPTTGFDVQSQRVGLMVYIHLTADSLASDA